MPQQSPAAPHHQPAQQPPAEQYPALGYPPQQYPADPQQQYPVDPQHAYPPAGIAPQQIPTQQISTQQIPPQPYPTQQIPPQPYPPQPYPTQQYPVGEYPQQPFGQPPYGPPQYPQQGWDQYGNPLPPKRNRNLAVVLSVAALVVVAVVVVVVVLVNQHGSKQNTAAPSASASPTAQPPSSTDSGSGPTTGPDATATGGQPRGVVPGWTTVSVGPATAVDVPPSWVTGSAAAQLSNAAAAEGIGACQNMPSSFRGIVEPLPQSSSDIHAILQGALVQFGYDTAGPQIALASPHPTTDGTFQDYRAVVGLTPPTTQNCVPPQAIVHILLKTDAGGATTALVIEGDQQCDQAPDPNDLDKIAMSVRTVS
jgi:hypothetical protein